MKLKFLLLFFLLFSAFTQAYCSEIPDRTGNYGLEHNLLWDFPPFKTYEFRGYYGISNTFEVNAGYGRQGWTYKGNSLTKGTIQSDALVLGLKHYFFQTRYFIDYSAWIMKDRFTLENGAVKKGWALSHEFFAGYRFDYKKFYWSPGINFGFYSHRHYTSPNDDRFKLTFVPKLVIGYQF
jgi:hypothetical protein